jgi:hypothetical protein
MDCQEFFRLHAQNGNVCVELQQLTEATQVEWESQSASSHSPGAVDNSETLFRQVMSPLHFDEESGEFKASLFSDVKNKGLSVNRAAHTTIALLNAELEKKVEKANGNPNRPEDRYPWGLLPFVSSKLRSVYVNETNGNKRRGLGVYDTATSNDQSHADVCQLVEEGAQARSVRKTLLDLANAWVKSRSGS